MSIESSQKLLHKNETGPEVSGIESSLKRHITDIEISAIGNKELIRGMSGAALGVKNGSIDRSNPATHIESFALFSGKSKVLIGPNGAGKSTVLDGLTEKDNAFVNIRSGDGAQVIGKPAHLRNKLRIARLEQEEILKDIEGLTAGDVLLKAAEYFKAQFPIEWDDVEKYEQNLENQEVHIRIDALVSKIAALFDMNGFMDRKVKELSGGERTKLSLFSILLSEPDILFLDEPTNHLDLRSISKLMALFNEYKRAGVSILSVSHVNWFLEEAGVDGVVEVSWNSESRTVTESTAPYEKYVKNPSREQSAVINGDLSWLQRDYGYKHGESVINSPAFFSIPDSPLKEVAIPEIHGGDLVLISGDNGTGKTKLMETIMRSKGDGIPKKRKGIQMAYLPQFWPDEMVDAKLEDFFDWVKENTAPLSEGASTHPHASPKNVFVKIARELSFGGSRAGEGWLNRPMSKFSGGEQRLLWFLIVSSLRNVDVLMLDEPTNHMDINLQTKVASAIQNFPGAVLLSTHDKNLITLLSKEGGIVKGAVRKPRHLVFTRKDDKTQINESEISPIEYMDRIMEEAKKQAKQFKI